MPRGLSSSHGIRLARWLYRRAFPKHGPDVSLALVPARAARLLNRRYRGARYAPDVLAFPLGRSGEVVVNRDAVATQAQRYGWPVAFEFSRLTFHGFLHLAGYDHARSPDRVRMERREHRILATLFPRLRIHQTVKQFLASA